MTLSVNDLTRRFYDPERGEFLAVDNVSFTVGDGEILGLIGPNGAGKTTTLRMIATLLPMTSGRVSINGVDISKEPVAARKNLGFLSSETGLYERFTPLEILNLFGQLSQYPLDKLPGRIDRLFTILQIEKFKDIRCGKLSSGTRQKVSIARAVIHDPSVICLDEATNGLDVSTMIAMHDFIKECRNLGKSILFSTHQMHEAERLCDRICMIHDGRIMALGTLGELRAKAGKSHLEDIYIDIIQKSLTTSPAKSSEASATSNSATSTASSSESSATGNSVTSTASSSESSATDNSVTSTASSSESSATDNSVTSTASSSAAGTASSSATSSGKSTGSNKANGTGRSPAKRSAKSPRTNIGEKSHDED